MYFEQVNPDMVPQFENAGLSFVGSDETGRRMEVSFFQIMQVMYSTKHSIKMGIRWF